MNYSVVFIIFQYEWMSGGGRVDQFCTDLYSIPDTVGKVFKLNIV